MTDIELTEKEMKWLRSKVKDMKFTSNRINAAWLSGFCSEKTDTVAVELYERANDEMLFEVPKPESMSMSLKPGTEKEWEETKKVNMKDAYSRCVVCTVLDVGAKLDSGESPEVAMKYAGHKYDITGFQAGCVAQWVAHFHPRGEEFRVWWNKEYGVSSDKGVVNPAVMTLRK